MGAQCCFRTSVANMPPDPASPAVCVARASAVPGSCTEDGPGGSGGNLDVGDVFGEVIVLLSNPRMTLDCM